MSCIDSNGAEVYARHMGCRELRNLGGHDAIIKGDSFCAIQWGSPVQAKLNVLGEWQIWWKKFSIFLLL